jgi:fructose-bisphosphate aldolase class II
MAEILEPAFEHRYGVGAFNIVDALTMEAVLAAASRAKSPVIIQVSVKTVKVIGARLIRLIFSEMANSLPIPTTLHLDHCPDSGIIKECLEAGWNSVLFDGSGLSYEDNLKQTKGVVSIAGKYGAAVEGELEAVKGVEDGIGTEEEGQIVPLDQALEFIRQTGIDSFAPAIGTAHGLYKGEPKINFDRVSEITSAEPIPLVIHGGTGLSDEVFQKLIARGAVKVNISTQLKVVFEDAFRDHLDKHPKQYDPLKLLGAAKERVLEMAMDFMRIFGSEGRAV